VLSISLTIIVSVYGVTSSINSEKANTYCEEIDIGNYVETMDTLIIPENDNQVCDSSTGVCAPPTDWYSTNN
jgi:hypothetical protein